MAQNQYLYDFAPEATPGPREGSEPGPGQIIFLVKLVPSHIFKVSSFVKSPYQK